MDPPEELHMCHSAQECRFWSNQSVLQQKTTDRPRHAMIGLKRTHRYCSRCYHELAVHTCMTVLLMDMSPGARCMMTGLRCHLAAASCKLSGIVAVNSRTCKDQAELHTLVHDSTSPLWYVRQALHAVEVAEQARIEIWQSTIPTGLV